VCRCNETFYEFSFFCEIGHWVELANSVAGGGCVHRWGVIDILLSGWAASELVRAEHAGGIRCTGMLAFYPSIFYLLSWDQGPVSFSYLLIFFSSPISLEDVTSFHKS
jgi:hypothetical protein